MGLLEMLRRQFPISLPHIEQLYEEELSWPQVKASSVSIPTIVPPEISRDFALRQPQIYEIPCLAEPDVLDLSGEILLPPPDIVDLFSPLVRPMANGTIYIKKDEELIQRGQRQTKIRVEPFRLRQRLDPAKPKGLDIFEMLLPILMPPATTEFREELLFPQELYPFQRAGVKWLFENESALLADDMGLGKTVQAITAFRALIRRSLALQALVICPKSVLTNWMGELTRWAPELIAMRIHGNQPVRRLAWQAYVGKCHVLVTTYETVRQDHELIRGRPFDLIVADETQRIKNPGTEAAQAMRSLVARRRWGLTGTPVENDEKDMMAIFRFIKPGLFQTSEIPLLSARSVRERVRPYVLRRRKEEALPELPKKVVDTKRLELTESQRQAYVQAEQEGVVRLRATTDVTVQDVLALIQQLKQICNFDPNSGESTKMEFLLEEYLEGACTEDQKALIFSQYVRTLAEIAKRIDEYKPLVYTGQLSMTQRDDIVNAFNLKDEHKVLLLSLRAGGLGLNLVRANYVLHFDRWWNPAVEQQAEARVDRFGQHRMVYATRLICKETIEERIDHILERKKFIFHEVVDELADVTLQRVLSEEELFGLFGLTPPRRVRQSPRDRDAVTAAQPSATEQRAAMEITPKTPYSNLLNLRQVLRKCERHIWYADRYFNPRGLEELIYTIDLAVVREVRILSGPENVDERAKREFARFCEEMEQKGVSAEWRVLKGFAHDRFILSESACFLVPSIDTIVRGQYSQILETPNRPPFDDWWKTATPIKDYKI